MARLVAIKGSTSGKQYEISQSCVLGRSFNSDIYVGDLNASRRHARITINDQGDCVLDDLGSGNGTFVNDAQLTAPRTLADRDVIRIGGSAFRFEPTKRQQWAEDVMTAIGDAITTARLVTRDSDAGQRTTQKNAAPSAAAASALVNQASQEREALARVTDTRAARMLQAMFAIADAIATELDTSSLLDKMLAQLLALFPQAERGVVLLVNPATGQLVPEAVKQRPGNTRGFEFSRTVVNQVMEHKDGILRDAAGKFHDPQAQKRSKKSGIGDTEYITADSNCFRFDEGSGTLALVDSGETPGAAASSLAKGLTMGAPLFCRGVSLGALYLEAASGATPFSADDLALLSSVARQAAVALANARASQALLSQQRLEDDLRLARQIQKNFLPRSLPRYEGFAFETHYGPAQQVGGDFYDIIHIGEHQLAVLVGDISGKGVSAALLMAKLTTDLRVLARLHRTPAEVLSRANSALIESGQDGMFATVLYILLDLETATYTVANAGHQPPIVVSERFSGIAELDDATAVALGVVPHMTYPQEIYKLLPGDVVLLYTDGINEALNRNQEEYGMDRLRTAIAGAPADPARLCKRLLTDVRRFVASAPQSDDQTVVCFGLSAGA